MKKVLLFFANGTEEIEALTVVDMLRRAGADVTVAGVGGKELIGSHAIRITADIDAEALTSFDYDMVVVPGGLPGTTHLDESEIVERALSAVHEKGGYLAAICAAPLVLGKRGYLIGKNATCYPALNPISRAQDFSESAFVWMVASLPAQAWARRLIFRLRLQRFSSARKRQLRSAVRSLPIEKEIL